MSDREHIENIVWKKINSNRFMKIFFIIIVTIGIVKGSYDAALPAINWGIQKAAYVLRIKPNKSEILNQKYSFWSGAYMYQMINLPANTKNIAILYYSTRHKMAKCFEVLDYQDQSFESSTRLINQNIFEQLMDDAKLRESYEGHLEKKGHSSFELYNAGYFLIATIEELQNPEINREAAIRSNNRFVDYWNKAQLSLPYKLPETYLTYIKKNSLSQKENMNNAVKTFKSIKLYFGEA